jgi:hypothetical protein
LQKPIVKLADFLMALAAKKADFTQDFGPVVDRGEAAVFILHIRRGDRYFFRNFVKFGVIAAVWAGNSHSRSLISR